jgi:phage-related protein
MLVIRELTAVFYAAGNNREPVREWLRHLPGEERRAIGAGIRYVQMKWPIGKPRVDHLRGEIWEVRTRLENRIARVLFSVKGGRMLLLHGFIKQTQKTPAAEIALAETRYQEWKNG